MPEKHSGLLKEIWESTTKISEESLSAAAEKAQSLKLDLDKGIVGFAETRINLAYSRDLIADAISHEKLIQLPLTIQQELNTLLAEIVQSVTGLTNGTDEIVLLANRVEKLNTLMWQYGFHNLSDQVLGYTKKINQLKGQELIIDRLLGQLRDVLSVRDSAHSSIKQLEEWQRKAESSATDVERLQQKVSALSQSSTEDQQKVSAAYASVKQSSEDASRLLSTITTSSGQATSLSEQIAQAFAVIDPRKTELATTIQTYEQANLANQNTANALLKKGN